MNILTFLTEDKQALLCIFWMNFWLKYNGQSQAWIVRKYFVWMTKTCYRLISVFLNPSPICKSLKIFKKRWSRDISLDLTTLYLYVTCTSTIMQLIPPPPHSPPLKFCITLSISPGYYSRPKRNWKQCLCKILGSKQGALQEMGKWCIHLNVKDDKIFLCLPNFESVPSSVSTS